MSNRICQLFGIRYPVVMGAVAQEPELGAAVSVAGGLGCIAGAIMPPAELRKRIHRMRELTDQPFAVNFPIVLMPAEQVEEKMRMMIEEGVRVVITSAGNPRLWTKFLQDGGCRVAHVLPTVYHAMKAADAGVDAIIAEPAESGGYRGEHEVSMMVLIPTIRRALPDMPLVAAGAVADGAGMAAVMALGAEGVQLGTRFLATVESNAPEPQSSSSWRRPTLRRCPPKAGSSRGSPGPSLPKQSSANASEYRWVRCRPSSPRLCRLRR